MISIVVPVYKVEPYLRQCLDSIINQTYRDFEILLIDDCSPDRCSEICDEYAENDERVRVFHLPENQGLSAARNKGLDEARGEYVGFVDSDDWIEPDMYECLMNAIDGAGISICGYYEHTKVTKYAQFTYNSSEEAIAALLSDDISNSVWNKLYRKELFNDILFPEGHNYEDVASAHLILNISDRVVVTDKVLYHYRRRDGSISQNSSAQNLIDYADAYLSLYHFAMNHLDLQNDALRQAAKGISKVWRWWYGCSKEERRVYQNRIKEYVQLNRRIFPLCGISGWPLYMRVSVAFMHSDSIASFFLLYLLNQTYRKVSDKKSSP